ncbi:uncharacterized protein AB9W97_000110 isoform 2-T3 [Spinachia spinachia]
MRMDSDPLMGLTECRGGKPRDATTDPPPGPAVFSRYYSVMDDDDNNFVPPPPSDVAPSLHADAQVNNSNMTFTKGSAEAVEAKDNPSGLGWHPGESRLMATQSAAEEVIVNRQQISTDATTPYTVSPVLPKDQDLKSMEEACCDPTRTRNHDGTLTEPEQSEPKDIAILSEGQKRCREAEAQSNKNSKQVPSNIEENSENTTHFDKEGESMCGFAETYSKLTVENADFGDVKSGEDSHVPPQYSKRDQNTMDAAICWPYVPEVPVEESKSETQASRHSISEETGQGDGSSRLFNGIQQGEQLIQRLQLVQLRQDVCQIPHAFQQAVRETQGRTKGSPGTYVDDSKAMGAHLTGGNDEEESGGARWNPMEIEGSERYDVEAEAGMSLVMPTVQSEQHKTAGAQAEDSEEDQMDSWAPADPDKTSSTQIPFLSTCHRLSAAEACVEVQCLQEPQGSLQRAGSILDLADDPDVLEIPFKNNIFLEPFPTEDGGDWQFTSQKMKEEVSKETRRELVPENQGNIPAGYSKGVVHQLKDTKLLFEAFQQDNAVGPTRPQKAAVKGPVYPSVLERALSLEMLSFKSRPVSRTHSFRLIKESEKHAEILRPLIPTSGSTGKTCLSHSVKHKEHAQLSGDCMDTPRDAGVRAKNANGPQECPVVRENPFFKLRPALALKPEVEKDIQEAKEREEELRRQRCTLYGENRPGGEDGEGSRFKPTHTTDVRKQSRGKLERVWPPPSKKDQKKLEQTQVMSQV